MVSKLQALVQFTAEEINVQSSLGCEVMAGWTRKVLVRLRKQFFKLGHCSRVVCEVLTISLVF